MRKTYKSYKPSGVEWIGDIPQGWSVAPLRWSCHVFAGGTPSRDNEEYWNSNDIPWLNSGEVNKEIIKQSDNYISHQGYENSSAKWIKPGSVLMALAGQGKTKGSVAALEIPATCNQSMAAIEPDPDRINYKQIYYYLKSRYHAIRGLVGDDRDGLNLEHVKSIKVPLPTLAEQEYITSYLDEKTTLIDSTIRKKEKLIELLLEERTAIINQAVTRGLDPNVTMKDSVVEWIGKIPENWVIKPLKHIKSAEANSFVDGPFGSNLKSEHFVENSDVYVIESGFITTGRFITKRFKTITKEHFETIKRSECKPGDIILAKIGANYGMSGILPYLDKPAVVSGNSLKLTVDSKLNLTEFVHFSLLALKRSGELEKMVTSTAQPALSLGELNTIKLAIPPLEVQKKIVTELKLALKRIDITLQAVQKEIQLFLEYRTALINEVVTGKRCVI